MKKRLIISMMLVILLVFCACGAQNETDPSEEELIEPEDVDLRTRIGFCLAGEGAFYDQLKADIVQACDRLDYAADIVTANSGQKQENDILAMLGAGVSAIVIDPVDVDALESALADAETAGVPVINIIDSINGRVSTLITPDYAAIGKSAGERAVTLLGEGGGRCLELKSDYDSFIMQLMSDGFAAAIGQAGGVTLAGDAYCGSDEQQAYQAVKTAPEDISFIFAHNEALARGALRAISESGRDVKLVVYGGGRETLQSVQSGQTDAAVFFGTQQLVDIAVGVADEFIKSATYEPSLYFKLTIDVATAENAAGYLADDLLHAQVREEAVEPAQ